jgi:hypothetical protein
MPRITYKTYYRCADAFALTGTFGDEINVLVNSYTFNGVLEDDGSYSAAPVWFGQFNTFPLASTGWTMGVALTAGEHWKFSWTTDNKDGTETEYIVEVVALSYCLVEFDNITCERDGIRVITWLTREGGWAYFAFNGKRTFEVKISEGKTYKNSDYIQRYSERPDVYTGELVTTGNIPETALDLMESLKTSIQAYVVDDYDTDAPVYKPIVIQDGDFIKRKTGDKRFDVSVNFIYAEQVQIQTG